MTLSAGDRAACGSSAAKERVGEQLSFDQWGRITKILRVTQVMTGARLARLAKGEGVTGMRAKG
eukprot:5623846-Prymnesium_polylepis.1